MLNIDTIASGSTGNCYHIEMDGTSLLIECGLPYKTILKHIGAKKLSKISGCLISHEHQDHCKGWRDIIALAKACYMSQGTYDKIRTRRDMYSYYMRIIEPLKTFRIGNITCMAFPTQHDAKQPVGFLLKSATRKLLFATDTYYLKYTFPGLTHIMIECNYDESTLNNNVEDGLVASSLRSRIMRSHFSLENVKKFFQANSLEKTIAIHLIHHSRRNLDIDLAVEEIKQLTGKPVYC